MKKALLSIVFLTGISIESNAYQSIRFSVFWMINNNNNNAITDIVASTSFGSADNNPPELKGYIQEIHADTLFIKILYKEHISVGSASSVSRLDTFTNIALPQAINYLHVSSNMIQINSQGEITDTLWSTRDSNYTIYNRNDSTFLLNPVGINDVHKNIPHISVYPNPANNTLYFEQGPEYQEAHVYNIIGQRVGIYPYNNTKSIDISRLDKGSYFLKLIGKKEESIGWAKFVKTAY